MGFFDNKTVTLFNRSFNAETEEETYYPTLLDGVDLVETKGVNVSKSGMDSADAAKLFVCIGDVNKTYMEPKAWDALTEDEKKNYITFHSTEDFLLREIRQPLICRKRTLTNGCETILMMSIR